MAIVSLNPNFSFAASTLSRFLTNPTEDHLAAAMRTLKYLMGTTHTASMLGSVATNPTEGGMECLAASLRPASATPAFANDGIGP